MTFQPGSFTAAVAALDLDESISKVRRVDPNTRIADLHAVMPALRDQVRNACAPSIRRAREYTGNTYRCEVSDVVMPSGEHFVVAVITRTE